MQSSEESINQLFTAWKRSSPAAREKAIEVAKQLNVHDFVDISLSLYSIFYGKGCLEDDVRGFFVRIATWRLAIFLGDKKVAAVQKQQLQLWLSRELKKESIKRTFPELLLSETAFIEKLQAYNGDYDGFAYLVASLLVKKHDAEFEALFDSLFLIRREYRHISTLIDAICEKKQFDTRLSEYLTKLINTQAALVIKSTISTMNIYEKAVYFGVYDQLVQRRDQLESRLLASYKDIEDFLNDFSGATLRKTALAQLFVLLRQ